MAELLTIAGLDGDDAFGGDGPLTLLAPTDAAFDTAFDEFGADRFEALESDPELLRSVLLHHATDGAIRSGDFVAGELTMLDGTAVLVDPDAPGGITFTSTGDASGVDDPATQLDIDASNGVVHAIDRLLVPDGLGLGAVSSTDSTTTATFAAGRVTLTGVVQSEEQRTALAAAATSQVDPANVVDDLVVDPDVVVERADVDRLAAIVAAMPPNLVDGEASLVGSALTLVGTYLDDAAQAVVSRVGTDLDATLELSARPAADAESAAALETELNGFVRENPILFEPNSTTLTAEADAVIEQLAARAITLVGTAITIVGHTDSGGRRRHQPDPQRAPSGHRVRSARGAWTRRSDVDVRGPWFQRAGRRRVRRRGPSRKPPCRVRGHSHVMATDTTHPLPMRRGNPCCTHS